MFSMCKSLYILHTIYSYFNSDNLVIRTWYRWMYAYKQQKCKYKIRMKCEMCHNVCWIVLLFQKYFYMLIYHMGHKMLPCIIKYCLDWINSNLLFYYVGHCPHGPYTAFKHRLVREPARKICREMTNWWFHTGMEKSRESQRGIANI